MVQQLPGLRERDKGGKEGRMGWVVSGWLWCSGRESKNRRREKGGGGKGWLVVVGMS